MATKLYIQTTTPAYAPATKRGAWDNAAGSTDYTFDTGPPLGGSVEKGVAEAVTTDLWDVLLVRLVSGQLAAQTITGTIDLTIPVGQSSTSANMFYHLYLYATTGDTDTPRGTLLSDYIDASEWATVATPTGKSLSAAQALSSLAVSDGDRLVLEIGYRAANVSATSFTGEITVGGHPGYVDSSNGLAGANDQNGHVDFSADLLWLANEARLAQIAAEVLVSATDAPDARVAQVFAEVLISGYVPPAGTAGAWDQAIIVG